MTKSAALAAVRYIESIKGDDEAAHSSEDELRRMVLTHIAEGGRNVRELARIALTTEDIEFARWYA